MAQFYKLRLPNGNVLTPSDWTAAEPLYSTVEISNAAFTIQTFFSYAIGGSVPGSVGNRASTLADTNLEGEGGRLPENEELVAFSWAIEVFMIGDEAALTDPNSGLPAVDLPDVSVSNMLRLQRDLLVKVKIAVVKFYTDSPLSWFPASTGTRQYNSGARTQISGGATGYIAANNGLDSVEGQRRFASPLYVKGGETLGVEVRPGPGQVTNLHLAANGRMRLRGYFDGYRKRPVA